MFDQPSLSGESVANLERPFLVGVIGGPGCRNGGISIRCVDVNKRDMRVAFGRLKYRCRSTNRESPTRRRCECIAFYRCFRSVGIEHLHYLWLHGGSRNATCDNRENSNNNDPQRKLWDGLGRAKRTMTDLNC